MKLLWTNPLLFVCDGFEVVHTRDLVMVSCKDLLDGSKDMPSEVTNVERVSSRLSKIESPSGSRSKSPRLVGGGYHGLSK